MTDCTRTCSGEGCYCEKLDAAQLDAYAKGRADEKEDLRTLLQQTQVIRDGWHPFTALALQAEILAALDDSAQCRHCHGKGWNDEIKAVDGHYHEAEVFAIDCEHCDGTGVAP